MLLYDRPMLLYDTPHSLRYMLRMSRFLLGLALLPLRAFLKRDLYHLSLMLAQDRHNPCHLTSGSSHPNTLDSLHASHSNLFALALTALATALVTSVPFMLLVQEVRALMMTKVCQQNRSHNLPVAY